MHLVLEVNTDKAVESAVERNYQELRELVRKNQIQGVSVERPAPNRRSPVQVQGKDNIEKFKALLDKELRDLRHQQPQRQMPTPMSATLDLPDDESDQHQEAGGGPGPRDHPQPHRPVRGVRARHPPPGRQPHPDPAAGHPGHPARQGPDRPHGAAGVQAGGRGARRQRRRCRAASPPGSEVLYKVDEDRGHQARHARPRSCSRKTTLLTGASLTDARVQLDSQYGEPYVSIEFDRKGARDLRARHRRERRASAWRSCSTTRSTPRPTIQEKIARRQGPHHRPLHHGGGPRPGHRPAGRRPARPGDRAGRAHGGPVPRRRTPSARA
ncbi:MAG: hypothetical protein MZV70_08435 [Desulfobacterales bacterium]|nr:hypothetical protein [Desulfobacterales bacterium]